MAKTRGSGFAVRVLGPVTEPLARPRAVRRPLGHAVTAFLPDGVNFPPWTLQDVSMAGRLDSTAGVR